MKSRGLWAAVILAILFVAWVAWISRNPPRSVPTTPSHAEVSPSPIAAGTPTAPATIPANTRTVPSTAPLPTGSAPTTISLPSPPPPATTAQITATNPNWRAQGMVELEKVHHMIGSYHTLYGENPVGTNAEIMKALMGGNPHGALLGPPPGQSLNSKGELLDPWGTPYFFHQLSGDDMQIISAGPDKIMGTTDDLMIP